MAAFTTVQVVSDSFGGEAFGSILYYTPFDPAQGLLRRVDVDIEGVFVFSTMIASGNPGEPAVYNFNVDQQLEEAHPGFSFVFADRPRATLLFIGTAPRFQPIPVTRFVSYQFRVDTSTDALGLTPLVTNGIDMAPAQIETRLENFVDSPCGDLQLFQSIIVMSFLPLSGPDLVAMYPYTYQGDLRITYEYVPHDQLQNQVANGDFEGPSLSPWSSSGAGTARLANPVQCLDGTPNRQIELAAGSPVDVQQSVATPADPFTLTFDYGFGQDSGRLETWLGNTRVDQIDASGMAGLFRTRVLTISDPAVLGQASIPLRFTWIAATGERAWIDDVKLYAVPEPSPAHLALAATLVLCALRRRHDGA